MGRKGGKRRRIKKSSYGFRQYQRDHEGELSLNGIEETLAEPEPRENPLPVFSELDASRLKAFRILWGELSEQQRDIMLLVTDGGLTSPTLIAERLGVKKQAVVTQFKRVKEKIEKALEEKD